MKTGPQRLHALLNRPADAPPKARISASPDPPEPGRIPERLDPGRPGLRLLAVLGALAAVVAGFCLWLSRPEEAPVGTRPSLMSGPTSTASPTRSTVVVHVRGKVRNPGVFTLPAGSRVADALEAAGGLRRGAGPGDLNLAREVTDGEQIPVGVKGTKPQPGTSPSTGTVLDLNTATVDQLDDLPGVGPVLARRIVEFRTRNGGFRSFDQLQDVSGIGTRRFADLKDKVRL